MAPKPNFYPFLGHFSPCFGYFYDFLDIRVVKAVFLENGVFVPCRKQVVLAKKGEKMTIWHSTHKNKGFCSSDPETDENDENGGCTQAKPPFSKTPFSPPRQNLYFSFFSHFEPPARNGGMWDHKPCTKVSYTASLALKPWRVGEANVLDCFRGPSPCWLYASRLSLSACMIIQGESDLTERRLIRLTFWDTLWEQVGLSDQSALIDASLWRKPL